MVDYFCHFSGAFLSFVLSFLGRHAAVLFKSNCGLYCKFYVRHSILMTLQCMMDDFIMNQHGVIRCLTLPVHIVLAGR